MLDLVPIIAIISVFGSTILFVITITNYILKKKMIEKNMVSSESMQLFRKVSSRQEALKWGLILFFGGIGLIINAAFDFDPETAMPYGIVAVCAALGFLVYYALIKNQAED